MVSKINSKYYTPEIEEFHVGFEYEITNGYEWVKKIFSKEDLKSFLYEQLENGINQQHIRVKYLDKEDIESLGWSDYIPPQEYNHVWKKGNFWISVWFNNEIPKVRITFKNLFFLFDGNIKNKSELKKLMQQLEIQ
tara:strand:- start:2350 stop:2757 length:408 start_codon:yes stop_codon:yes gene_type:complete